ncbi:ZIM-domain protein 7 [Artemisia annua]|uniref:Protein TIFY n=1 Tax=Artemisia annua TaxID=35608 RepID=A0A2U1LZA0_ARTAN|nr:ZIM-domain protein 7 [Artemisia annua]
MHTDKTIQLEATHPKTEKDVEHIRVNHGAQFGGPPIKQQGLSVPSIGSFLAGTTEPWYSTKASCAPAQLTIFYGGMVNVYDDISPEKAQAIMFLAGNGASSSTPRVQPQTPVPRTPVGDVVYNAQPINVGSAMSSPISVSSHPVGQPLGGPTNRDDGAKTVGGSSTPITKLDTPRVINSLEQVMQSAVPQARKASLARFLEKRKERYEPSGARKASLARFLEKRKERSMASSPYGVSKSSSDCIASPGPSNMNAVAAGEH